MNLFKRISIITTLSSVLAINGADKTQRHETSQRRQISTEQQNKQSTFDPGAVPDQQLHKTVNEMNKASSFTGMEIRNLQNEKVGKVNDLVFDPEQGKISYVVISVGGILGVADKLVAVPLTSLKAEKGATHLVINLSKDQLNAAPGLARNKWPDLDAFASTKSTTSSTAESSGAPPANVSSSAQNQSTSSPSSGPAPSTEKSTSGSETPNTPDQSKSSNADPSNRNSTDDQAPSDP
jgi:sporulation protein YlmC with PRC-barrel domain